MTIKHAFAAGAAVMALGSLAMAPSPAFAQASPGSSSDVSSGAAAVIGVGSFVGGALLVRFVNFFPTQSASREVTTQQALNSIPNKKARHANNLRAYKWNLALAR